MAMRASEATVLFRELTEGFFGGYAVAFANQSRIAKPQIPLVLLTPGNVRRPQAANNQFEGGEIIGHYLSRMPIIVDLFTNGTAVEDDDGSIVAYANSAMDEMLAFADYLNSPKCIAWCHKNDVSILIEMEVRDITGLVNDNNYEFRSQMEVLFFFTQETDQATGDMGYFSNVVIEDASTNE